MNKSLYEILVPVYFESSVDRELIFTGWENRLIDVSGGLTKLPQVKGVWVNEGIVYVENNIPYRVYVNEEECLDLLEYAKKTFNQITIMAYKISSDVIFYSGT